MNDPGSVRPADPPAALSGDRVTPRPRPADAAGSLDELDVLLRVGDILRKVRFGTVLIVVQDGKVVQIEMAEKIRLR